MDKILLTIQDFVGLYSVSRTATYREVAAGRLRLTKVGSRSYIASTDARNWLDALRKRESGAIAEASK